MDDVSRDDDRPDQAEDPGEQVADQVADQVTDPAGGEQEQAGSASLGAELRQMWHLLDPVPSGLAERVVFSLEVDALTGDDLDLELELMRLQQTQTTGAGARGDDEVRTVTFGSESMTVMLAISDVEGGHRIDGWVAPGGRREIEVRTTEGTRREECDETGRFALALVPPGHFQLVLVGDDPGDTQRAVVTPALTL